MFNFIRNLGLTEVIIIVLLLVIFFGSKRMSQIAKTAGESTKELKKVKKEYQSAVNEVNKDPKEKDSE
jgi:Sec-independent protein translocase protein TatA